METVKNNFVFLTVIVFVVFSCGCSSKNDVLVSQYTKAKDYPAGALAKMKSLVQPSKAKKQSK